MFDRAIFEQSHDGRPGDLAVIFDRKRRFLAVGLYDPHSSILAPHAVLQSMSSMTQYSRISIVSAISMTSGWSSQ